MNSSVELHGWRFNVDREATTNAYRNSKHPGAAECDCAYCRNLVAQREVEYPRELLAFLESVGVDPHKEAEVWEVGPLSDGRSYNAGWWHFVGKVEAKGPSPVRLSPGISGRAKDWEVVFDPGKRDLKLAELPNEPLVQVGFSVQLPWVLDEPYPG